MPNQPGKQDEYDPEIQAVIDRFISGEIEVKNRPAVDPADHRPPPKIDTRKWHDSHESAKKALDYKKKYWSWR